MGIDITNFCCKINSEVKRPFNKLRREIMVKKAVILAAGKGTRFLPYTKAYPKEMLAVIDKPALQLTVEELVESGIKDIMIVISPDKQGIANHFKRDDEYEAELRSKGKDKEADFVHEIGQLANISYGFQYVINGMGGAVMVAKEFVCDQHFAVLNGDDVMWCQDNPVTKQLVEAYNKTGKSVVGVQAVSRQAISKYATCKLTSSDGRLHGIDDIIEKPSPDQIYSLLAPLGRYVLTPDIFDVIEHHVPINRGEYFLTDALRYQAQNGGIYVYDFEGKRYDFGDKFGYLKAVTEYGTRHKEFGPDYIEFLKEYVKTL